jgi:hypothetical protein
MSIRNIPFTGWKRNTPLTPPSDLVDEMLAYYINWRHDAAAVWDAYAAWVNAPVSEKPSRFSAYTAALEQEQSAATSYSVVVENVARAAPREDWR